LRQTCAEYLDDQGFNLEPTAETSDLVRNAFGVWELLGRMVMQNLDSFQEERQKAADGMRGAVTVFLPNVGTPGGTFRLTATPPSREGGRGNKQPLPETAALLYLLQRPDSVLFPLFRMLGLRLATSATLGDLPWELLLHYVCNSTAHTSLPGAGVLSGHEARVQRFGAAALRQAFEN